MAGRGSIGSVLILSMLLSACASRTTPAPVSSLSSDPTSYSRKINLSGNSYRVKRGDTLYSIAFSANMDVRELAKLNNLSPPYTIFPDQKIDLVPDLKKNKKAQKYRTQIKKSTKNNQKNNIQLKKELDKPKQREYVRKQVSRKVERSTSAKSVNLKWFWPAQGKVTRRFSIKENGYKGLEISNKLATPVKAAADGSVVYAGDALRGYGKLIIVKHNDDYLSAYAHNSRLLVKEKQEVKAGQKIAEMGNSDSPVTALRFEIRYRGQAVNPAKFLP